MGQQIAFRTAAEVLARTTMPVEEATEHTERAYRRGCHQVCARINDLLDSCKDFRGVKDFIGVLEDVLCEYREDPNEGGLALLDVAVTEARKRQKP